MNTINNSKIDLYLSHPKAKKLNHIKSEERRNYLKSTAHKGKTSPSYLVVVHKEGEQTRQGLINAFNALFTKKLAV